ncbi:MAG TPA: hypothetical protein VEJ18_04315 [Planctomycetota bacterium]|nr:hypothetical protein [Planctomycetota bacterium]
MKDTIELTASEGTTLLRDAFSGVAIPAEIEGLGKWDQGTRGVIAENIGHLLKALRKASPIYQKHHKIQFGPLAWYDEQDRSVNAAQKEVERDQTGEEIKKRWVLRDEHRHSVAPVTLNAKAYKGLCILLLLKLHPGMSILPGQKEGFSQAALVGHQVEWYWPVAEKLGIDVDLQKKIGLDKTATDVPFKTNEEYEAEDEKAKAKSGSKDDVAEAAA